MLPILNSTPANQHTFRAILFGIVLALGSLFAADTQADTLTLSVGGDYPPWVDAALEDGGHTIALLKHAAELAQIDLHIEVSNWSRAYTVAMGTPGYITAPWQATPERAHDFLFTQPIVERQEWVYVRSNVIPPEAASDFDGLSVCWPNVYTVLGKAGAAAEAGVIDRVSPTDMRACFRMLMIGRTDAVISIESEAENAMLLEGLDPELFRQSETPNDHLYLVVLVSRATENAEQLRDRLDAALTQLLMNGTYGQLLSRY